MQDFAASMRSYEEALRAALGSTLVTADLAAKHDRMAESAFLFLRATCWRWAESAATLCPDLIEAPAVPSVGDAHAGNFGLWRDAGARLVWGINDYDEAAPLPWPLDLVRLCASLLLGGAAGDSGVIANAALDGYAHGLAKPRAFVLERDHLWLRDAFAASDKKRAEFWQELADAPPGDPPPDLHAALESTLPEGVTDLKLSPRVAGAGSLGRPRFVAAGEYRGGPIAIEAKALLPSCWGAAPGLAARMANGPWRSPDPTLAYGPRHVLRRLAPNSRKLDLEKLEPGQQDKLIAAMARDLAAVHGETDALRSAIDTDLARRGKGWLAHAASEVARWTEQEFAAYRDAHRKGPP
jgi:hypothetical protein